MSSPYIAPAILLVLREYLAAQTAYKTARLALIVAFAAEVQTWIRQEELTEGQLTDRLRVCQVPEDLLTAILDAARDPEEP
jgi:hypothetical protein